MQPDAATHLLDQLRLAEGASSTVLLFGLLWWETAAPFFPFFAGDWQGRLRHGLRNVLLGAFNGIATALLFLWLWNATATWAESRQFGLLHLAPLPAWAHLLGALILLDAWMYAGHWLNHHVPFLWRFHRVHHTDPHMDVTTANRFHVGEIVFFSLLRTPLIALFGAHFWEVVAYEVLFFLSVQFQHANIALPAWMEQPLRGLIVTPGLHKVHHSRWQPETDSNLGSVLSLWDRLFGTLRLKENARQIHFGLDAFDGAEHQKLSGLLRTPFSAPLASNGSKASRASRAPDA